MINKTALDEIIEERIRICNDGDEWSDGIDMCREKIADMFLANIDETIDFILNICDDEEFFWVTEGLDELSEKARSAGLINAYKERLAKVSLDTYDQIKFKANFMREMDYHSYVKNCTIDIQFADGWVD